MFPNSTSGTSYLFDRRVFVGDVVVVKDPDNPDKFLVRRLAAIEGYEMLSTDEKDDPFVLEKDECWVLADNETLKPKVAMFEFLFRQNIKYICCYCTIPL